MTTRSRGSALLAASLASLAILSSGCGGGGGGKVSGGGDNQQAAFNFTEANMRYAAGAAARAVDTFPPLSDLLDASLQVLWQPGAVQAGQPKALAACAAGTASLTWTDTNGDGAWSAGDGGAISVRDCRVHPGDTEVLSGEIILTFTTVSRGPPLEAVATIQPDLGARGGPVFGTVRGRAELTATSPDGVRHSFTFLPSGNALLSITGSASMDFACFDVRNDPTPALGFTRRIAILGDIRALGKVLSFSPGARLLYREDDRPGDGRIDLLSFMDQPSCPAMGISDGVGDSDGSTLSFLPGSAAGDMRLELHRSGQAVSSSACSWSELLHPELPHEGVISGSNALQVASLAVTSLGLPHDVGALATDLVLGAYRGTPVQLCTSGSYGVAPSRPTLAVGETVTITFTSCSTTLLGPSTTLGGSATVAIAGVSGAPASGAYALSTTLGSLEVTTTSAEGASHVTGGFRFSRTAAGADVTEHAEAIPGTALVLAETSSGTTVTRRTTAFSVTSGATATGSTFASARDVATVTADGVDGELAVSVAAPVHGAAPASPGAGKLKVTARDATSLTLDVGAGGAVALGLDGDGDGAVDATLQASWSELR